jgi:hypothetical protein
MDDGDVEATLELINKRLDWIEESLGRVIGLQYVPMGRTDHRPDEVPAGRGRGPCPQWQRARRDQALPRADRRRLRPRSSHRERAVISRSVSTLGTK